MARIFSISFPYNGIAYNAMISMHSTEFFTEYNITSIDEELQDLLPGNKIIATEPDNLFFINITKDNSNVLMAEIIKAVTKHLHSVNYY